jgi:hypothetical protein
MATTVAPAVESSPPVVSGDRPHLPRAALVAAMAVAVGLAVAGAVVASGTGSEAAEVFRVALVAAWSVAGAVIAIRRRDERLGPIVLAASSVAGAATLAAALARAHHHASSGPGGLVAAGRLALPVALALLPAFGMQLLLSLPDGSCRVSRAVVRTGYVVGLLVGLGLWTRRPTLPLWPLALESTVAVAVGFAGSNRRYRRARGVERQRMQWFGWAVLVAVEITLVTLALRLLAAWPPHGVAVAAAATLPMPVALAVATSPRLLRGIDRLLAYTVSTVGLSGVVVAVYLVVVLGLGRTPSAHERSLLVLSMLAAAVAALLFVPARERLSQFSNRLVYGEREAPDEVVRTFGSRLSRAVALDELLLQVAESLQKSLGLSSAEVWTGSGGRLERVVSVPYATVARIALSPEEEAVVARAGVSGWAWAEVWTSTSPKVRRTRKKSRS